MKLDHNILIYKIKQEIEAYTERRIDNIYGVIDLVTKAYEEQLEKLHGKQVEDDKQIIEKAKQLLPLLTKECRFCPSTNFIIIGTANRTIDTSNRPYANIVCGNCGMYNGMLFPDATETEKTGEK